MHTAVALVFLAAAADDAHNNDNCQHTTANVNVHHVIVRLRSRRLGRGLGRRLSGGLSRRLSGRLSRRLSGRLSRRLSRGHLSRRLSRRLGRRLSRGYGGGRLSGRHGGGKLSRSAGATNSIDIRKRKRFIVDNDRKGSGVESKSGRSRFTDLLFNISKSILTLLVEASHIHDVVYLTRNEGCSTVEYHTSRLRCLEIGTMGK